MKKAPKPSVETVAINLRVPLPLAHLANEKLVELVQHRKTRSKKTSSALTISNVYREAMKLGFEAMGKSDIFQLHDRIVNQGLRRGRRYASAA